MYSLKSLKARASGNQLLVFNITAKYVEGSVFPLKSDKCVLHQGYNLQAETAK